MYMHCTHMHVHACVYNLGQFRQIETKWSLLISILTGAPTAPGAPGVPVSPWGPLGPAGPSSPLGPGG